MWRALAFSCLMTWLPAVAAAADPELDPVQTRAVRAVVEGQLKALAAERASDAFSYASTAIRAQFHDAAVFAAMVRRSYPMLIRPLSVSYLRPESDGGVVTQSIQVRDRDGSFWRAVYELRREPDGSWRINGCAVAPDDDSSTT